MLRVLLSGVALLLFTSVQAQQYPSRPIRFVMAYPPGGSSDAGGRDRRVGTATGVRCPAPRAASRPRTLPADELRS